MFDVVEITVELVASFGREEFVLDHDYPCEIFCHEKKVDSSDPWMLLVGGGLDRSYEETIQIFHFRDFACARDKFLDMFNRECARRMGPGGSCELTMEEDGEAGARVGFPFESPLDLHLLKVVFQ